MLFSTLGLLLPHPLHTMFHIVLQLGDLMVVHQLKLCLPKLRHITGLNFHLPYLLIILDFDQLILRNTFKFIVLGKTIPKAIICSSIDWRMSQFIK